MEKHDQSVSKQIADVRGLAVSNGLKLDEIKRLLRCRPGAASAPSDEDDEDSHDPNYIQLPCQTINEYRRFEQRLKSDAKYRKKTVSASKCFLD